MKPHMTPQNPWRNLLGGRRPGPVQRFLGAAGAIVALIAAAFLSAVFFGVFLVVFAVIGLIVGVRLWWLRRQLGRAGMDLGGDPRGRQTPSATLEGEYRVIHKKEPPKSS